MSARATPPSLTRASGARARYRRCATRSMWSWRAAARRAGSGEWAARRGGTRGVLCRGGVYGLRAGSCEWVGRVRVTPGVFCTDGTQGRAHHAFGMVCLAQAAEVQRPGAAGASGRGGAARVPAARRAGGQGPPLPPWGRQSAAGANEPVDRSRLSDLRRPSAASNTQPWTGAAAPPLGTPVGSRNLFDPVGRGHRPRQ